MKSLDGAQPVNPEEKFFPVQDSTREKFKSLVQEFKDSKGQLQKTLGWGEIYRRRIAFGDSFFLPDNHEYKRLSLYHIPNEDYDFLAQYEKPTDNPENNGRKEMKEIVRRVSYKLLADGSYHREMSIVDLSRMGVAVGNVSSRVGLNIAERNLAIIQAKIASANAQEELGLSDVDDREVEKINQDTSLLIEKMKTALSS